MSVSATGIILPAANSVFSNPEPCLLPYTFCLYLFSYLADYNKDHLKLLTGSVLQLGPTTSTRYTPVFIISEVQLEMSLQPT